MSKLRWDNWGDTYGFDLSDFINVRLEIPLGGDIQRALGWILLINLDHELTQLFCLDANFPFVLDVVRILDIVRVLEVVAVVEAIVETSTVVKASAVAVNTIAVTGVIATAIVKTASVVQASVIYSCDVVVDAIAVTSVVSTTVVNPSDVIQASAVVVVDTIAVTVVVVILWILRRKLKELTFQFAQFIIRRLLSLLTWFREL